MTAQSNPFQSITNLGALKSIHGFSRYFRNNRILVSGMILAGIFSCICMVAYGLVQDAQRGADLSDFGTVFVTAGFMILLAFFIIFWFLQDWLKNRNYSAALFVGGIATYDQTGRVDSARWQDIQTVQAIRLKPNRAGFLTYNVICKDGHVLVLPHFLEGLDHIVKSVNEGAGAVR